jgi:transcriptional regulator with XRE-family HTH domain
MKTNYKAETYSSSLIDELLKGISPEDQERTDNRMLLAARIDDGIKAKAWKKKDFANAMGKTPSEITKWLSGTHNFTSDTLFDIARVLGINLIQTENEQKSDPNQVFVYLTTTQSIANQSFSDYAHHGKPISTIKVSSQSISINPNSSCLQ